MNDDILNQKVKRVLIVVELENGKSLIANPSEIGKVDGLVTMKDLQRLMGNDDGSDDMKFMSPFVFALDMQDAAREWIKELENHKDGEVILEGFYSLCEHSDCCCMAEPMIAWIKHFFNLNEE